MIPTPQEQVEFLQNIQRLLAEGLFTASYKYALLLSLADLAVQKGDGSGAALDLDTRDIAAEFIRLYWPQSRPFQVGGVATDLILKQNTDRQAVIITQIAAAQQECDSSLFRLKQLDPKGWNSLVSKVRRTVCGMPLDRLQTVGDERLDFLYQIGDGAERITLTPCAAYCLRAFHGLLRNLIQGAWVGFVQRLNSSSLGNVTDLGTFLFGQERTNLDAYRPILMDVQHGLCLYCGESLRGQTQVDHFVPWSRYPADLGHNFVLAHNRCNLAKSDYLAAEKHLASWAERNDRCKAELQAQLQEAALPCDAQASQQIARWAYEQTERANGQVWVTAKVLEHLGPTWREYLSV